MARYEILILVAGLLFGYSARADEPKKTDGADKALAQIQGKWELDEKLKLPDGTSYRKVKEIKGRKETMRVFDENNQVVLAWTVDIKIQTEGKVRIFSWTNMTIIEGEEKGKKYEGIGGYVYRVRGDSLFEISGLLEDDPSPEPALMVWKRLKE